MGQQRSGLGRRFAALLVAAGAATFGVGILVGGTHASAQGIPTKTCVDPSTASGEAQPGDTISCTVDIDGVLLNGSSYTVEPTAPTGAYITACGGASGGTSPDNYTSTATSKNLGAANSSCTFTISSTLPLTTSVQNQIGTESLFIPSSTAAGTSVTQQAEECVSTQCGPFTPMGVSGAGSCVGGTALPVIGGCQPSLPGSGTPTPTTATPTPSNHGGGGGSGGGGNPTPTSGVKAAKTSTPFTGGPDHPFPVAATGVVFGGLLLALGALVSPLVLRRRRTAPVRDTDR